jgi:hypothetical protein
MKPSQRVHSLDRKRMIAVLVATLVLGLLARWGTAHQRVERRAREIDSIVTERLPVGTDTDVVLAFLDSARIEHSEYQPKSRRIYAAMRNVAFQFPAVYGIFLRFDFDEARRLESYEVNVAGDAP